MNLFDPTFIGIGAALGVVSGVLRHLGKESWTNPVMDAGMLAVVAYIGFASGAFFQPPGFLGMNELVIVPDFLLFIGGRAAVLLVTWTAEISRIKIRERGVK